MYALSIWRQPAEHSSYNAHRSSDLDFEPEQQELLLHLVQEYGLSLPLELAARINVKAQATEASK